MSSEEPTAAARVVTSLDSSNDRPLSEQYLEQSKDVDRYQLSFDDDDDDELVCRNEDDDDEDDLANVQLNTISKPLVTVGSLVGSEQETRSLELKSGMTDLATEKYSLFEQYLSFLKTDKDANGEVSMLNPVLLGYWCNLFKSLVQTHAQEVFIYVYQHEEFLSQMLDHLYSPQMSDILVRLLNFNSSVFTRKEQSSVLSSSSPNTSSVNTNSGALATQEIS